MEADRYRKFSYYRRKFRKYVDSFPCSDEGLVPVYNSDLDRFGRESAVKYILVGDNPGEQERIQQRYLIGKAGQAARNFFHGSGLVQSFDEQVLVLNKTFLHTKSTLDLKALMKDDLSRDCLAESQRFMARLAFDLHVLLDCRLWITGCSELKERGIFGPYRQVLGELYPSCTKKKNLLCFKHFSYGNFSRDLNSEAGEDLNLKLSAIGLRMRETVFGW